MEMADKKENVTFKKFRSVCKYHGIEYSEGCYFDDVCNLKVPPGKSWGKCEESYCPYFGEKIKMKNIAFYDGTGKKICKAEKGKARAVRKDE